MFLRYWGAVNKLNMFSECNTNNAAKEYFNYNKVDN